MVFICRCSFMYIFPPPPLDNVVKYYPEETLQCSRFSRPLPPDPSLKFIPSTTLLISIGVIRDEYSCRILQNRDVTEMCKLKVSEQHIIYLLSYQIKSKSFTLFGYELGWLSRYSDGLMSGRPGFDSQQGQEIVLFSTESRGALRPSQPPIHWGKAVGAWSCLLTSIYCRGQEGWNYTSTPPMRLNGIMLN
jgi:hypothetical protein